MRASVVSVALSVLVLGGCAAQQQAVRLPKYTQFYARQPRSILVLPALNESPEVSAGPVFSSTITTPLAERGYYVFPIYLTAALLGDLGLTEAGLIHQLPPQKLHELFGADAVLFVTIHDWSTKYLVLKSAIVVSMEYQLKDARSGELLWHESRQVVKQSGGGGSGNPIADVIVMAVDAAITALVTDYRPLARQANFQVVAAPGAGLPAGQYSPSFGQDRELFY